MKNNCLGFLFFFLLLKNVATRKLKIPYVYSLYIRLTFYFYWTLLLQREVCLGWQGSRVSFLIDV